MRNAITEDFGISLRQILPGSQFFGANDVLIKTCCGNWNECQKNDLFVAMVDADSDGHEQVELAIARGAKAILSERLLAVDVPQCIVDNSNEAYARICQTLAGNPSQYLTTFGITGSDGKTTIAHLLQNVLIAAGEQVAVASSLKTTIGDEGRWSNVWNCSEKRSTAELADWLSHATLSGATQAIIEASSLQLANHQFAGMQLDAAIIGNIRAHHLNYHNSAANYRQVTLRLLDYLNSTGIAILNADDPASNQLLENLKRPAITYAIKQDAEVTATPLEECFSEQVFLLTAGNETAPVRTEIIGRNHIMNCLAAASAALAAGHDLPTIVKGLENLRRIAGRLERVECGQPFAVFVDLADSPRRLAGTLSTLKRMTQGKLICVAAVGEKADGQSEMGRVLENGCHVPVLSTPLISECRQLELCHQWLDGFKQPARAHVIPNRVTAIEWALQQAHKGDCVLVVGFGDKPVCSLDQGRWQLTDREICQAWLYEHPVSPLMDHKRSSGPFRLDDTDC
ncbi:MAG TPA: Mur ligase family protein [Pirellulaceae bacterium]|nr:Mur ligase family protein [Pirellulaceae bacterium]HMO90724.1 Mur ligase family protein [Pirellulaceae bacterium]HMP67975.1 Mur ligase family protein [Pirellulaceae bacterium]